MCDRFQQLSERQKLQGRIEIRSQRAKVGHCCSSQQGQGREYRVYRFEIVIGRRAVLQHGRFLAILVVYSRVANIVFGRIRCVHGNYLTIKTRFIICLALIM